MAAPVWLVTSPKSLPLAQRDCQMPNNDPVTIVPDMSRLPGQRTQFTWALNQYNKTDDPKEKNRFARLMAYRIKFAETIGFTQEQITNGKSYPADEVKRHYADPDLLEEPEVAEEE
jgi:hypothetical protein